jgi:hypothetical protein
MLLDQRDIVTVRLYYKKQGYSYLVFTEAEIKEKHDELEKSKKNKQLSKEDVENISKKQEELNHDNFEKLEVQMRVLTWGDYNRFQENATKTLADGERYFDYKTYKEDRLKNLIVGWDAKDKEDRDIPFSPTLLLKMPYQIAESITRGFDEETFYDEEREKN